jgi:hypothetical protein
MTATQRASDAAALTTSHVPWVFPRQPVPTVSSSSSGTAAGAASVDAEGAGDVVDEDPGALAQNVTPKSWRQASPRDPPLVRRLGASQCPGTAGRDRGPVRAFSATGRARERRSNVRYAVRSRARSDGKRRRVSLGLGPRPSWTGSTGHDCTGRCRRSVRCGAVWCGGVGPCPSAGTMSTFGQPPFREYRLETMEILRRPEELLRGWANS